MYNNNGVSLCVSALARGLAHRRRGASAVLGGGDAFSLSSAASGSPSVSVLGARGGDL